MTVRVMAKGPRRVFVPRGCCQGSGLSTVLKASPCPGFAPPCPWAARLYSDTDEKSLCVVGGNTAMSLRGLVESQEGACPDKYKRNKHVAIAPEPVEPAATVTERAERLRQPLPTLAISPGQLHQRPIPGCVIQVLGTHLPPCRDQHGKHQPGEVQPPDDLHLSFWRR